MIDQYEVDRSLAAGGDGSEQFEHTYEIPHTQTLALIAVPLPASRSSLELVHCIGNTWEQLGIGNNIFMEAQHACEPPQFVVSESVSRFRRSVHSEWPARKNRPSGLRVSNSGERLSERK